MNRGNIEKILRENSSGWLNEGEVQNITDLIIDEVNSWKQGPKEKKKEEQTILPTKSKRNTIVAVKQSPDEITKPSTVVVLKPNGRVTPDNK